MVSPEEEQGVFEFDFEWEDESEYLDWEASSVDVVSEKEIFGGLEGSSCVIVDEFDEIIELSVDVAYNGNWILYFDHVAFWIFVWLCLRKMCLALLII